MKTSNKKNKSNEQEKKSENIFPEIKIPNIKELSKDEIIEIYREEIKKKDKIISELQNENRLLFDLTMKNAKRKLEELENKLEETQEQINKK